MHAYLSPPLTLPAQLLEYSSSVAIAIQFIYVMLSKIMVLSCRMTFTFCVHCFFMSCALLVTMLASSLPHTVNKMGAVLF